MFASGALVSNETITSLQERLVLYTIYCIKFFLDLKARETCISSFKSKKDLVSQIHILKMFPEARATLFDKTLEQVQALEKHTEKDHGKDGEKDHEKHEKWDNRMLKVQANENSESMGRAITV